jgi:DNA-binding winged helix-turn-helix (wHTH) protein/tetratricopeptide (TPR) repeat protein
LPQKHFYEFGPYRIDVALSRLERAGIAIPLPPKAFDLLLLLARNHDRVMTKGDLMDTLWPKMFVEEANLTQHVYTLRKILGDQANGKPYIETVARRGYHLAADVRESELGPTSLTTNVTPPERSPIEPADTTPIVLEGERKHGTVLHCTLANAAGVVERLGSAGMHDVMQLLVDIATEETARYEGVISQRHADGFVAVFGAPVVHEDDARRAILAALAIQQALVCRSLNGESDEDRLELQIGVSTGPLVISRAADDRHVAYTAVGETIRTADLLQQFAEPGTVLISEASRRVVEKHVSVEPVTIPSAPGVQAYRVVGRLRQTPGASRLARAYAPFTGRQREVSLLDELVAQAIAGNGQAVSLVGEPGMGKSRLVAELTQRLNAGASAPTILEGHCVSYGSLRPYLPLTDIVRASCGVEESDPAETIQRAVDHVVRDNGLPSDATMWLLRLLGADDRSSVDTVSPEAVKARTFDVLRLLFLRMAARHPVVMVVEDVHWIDRTSEEFLTTLVERLVGVRAMLIATHRPGYLVPLMDRSYVTQITLSPLNAADSARIVESVAQASRLDADVSSAILARGEGNPFFLEELARTVVERGSGTETIPGTVHGVIMARIDRLPDVAKQLLQTASVLGREVPLALLRRVWSGSVAFEAEIDELRRLEFVFERPGDEPSYVFKHALTQDVAYDSLLARTRREIHLRAARALEELYADRADDMAATLAYHYARTDNIPDAVKWLTRAAERAARVYANAEAILHLDLAARRLQRLPEHPDRDRWMLKVALQQAHSLYFLGRFRESVDVLLPHDARLARLADVALTAAYAFWLAHMYSRLGDRRLATENARRAIEAATAAGDEATLAKAHGLLALEGHFGGNPDEGIAHGARAVALLEAHPDQRWWLGMAHFYLSMNHVLRGDFDGALAEASRADAVGRAIGDPRLQTYAGFAVGWAEASRGHHDTAIACCGRSLAQAPDRVSRAYASLFLGYALMEHGQCEEAMVHLGPVVGELEGFAFPQWHALAATLSADSLRALGRLDEAESAVEKGLHVATQVGYLYAVGFSHRAAGRIARDRGAAGEAKAAFQRALETFERSGAAFEAARTRVELARLEEAVSP